MAETIMELNNLSLAQIRNDILQDYVGETEITFFLYDALGKLLLSCPDEDELKRTCENSMVSRRYLLDKRGFRGFN